MSASVPTNRFKAALAAQQTQVGLWSSLSSPVVAELIAGAGFDWLLFDTEHSPITIPAAAELLRSAAHSDSQAAVRVAWNDPVLIKQVLDIGAQTVFVPFVQSAEEARAAVRACRYPPDGIRGVAGATRASGYGRRTTYLQEANDQIAVVLQVETKEALDQLEEIAGVEGVDGVFIGPSDLSASFGHLGNPGATEMQAVLKSAAARLNAIGKASGILAGTSVDANRYLSWGYTFVAAGVDTALLTKAVDTVRSEVSRN
ncbi:HpcH/HpaI aldolase/citrate lyase family protein [Cognatishimia sp. SS12]|uniref:HpcH/HpaI aldolase family protein n=1 Tax=Cognatishimia sp. SS12 TaxID=2979465 RepID=UPI00232C931F|nr:HpcH/HpaI aldolase/citrate lyase family protein [Cognatishimia sp. SS12]MDC0739609.1 HpcH/HpaI aldolase/citrate lyase family protein [Cognatishimia sp. SS12]